ncbi:MAG: hypothetical protein HKN25_10600 [Pyrinomonadaceae bacterium]|nr:hypothetical protein [Pyrinomonadaceae bacterium]
MPRQFFSFPVAGFALLITVVLFSTYELIGQNSRLSVFIRFKVVKPSSKNIRVTTTGRRHAGAPWNFPRIDRVVKSDEWSDWIELSDWKWHGKIYRAGGIAEYPSLQLTLSDLERRKKPAGCELQVQLSDSPTEKNVVINFSEKSDGNSIMFLAPYPLRENAKDFETARQMASRHAAWAEEIVGDNRIELKHFEMISSIWTRHDQTIVDQEVSTLKRLGFNVITNLDHPTAKRFGFKVAGKTWLYNPDPEEVLKRWNTLADRILRKEDATSAGKEKHANTAYYEIADEVSAVNLKRFQKTKLDRRFREYLKRRDLGKYEFGIDLDEIEYPTDDLFKDTLPKSGPVERRRLLYHAAKFGHFWSVRQMKLLTDLIREDLPGMNTGTLLPSHGFLGNAWGPKWIGMSYRMLDSFELAEQNAVTQISTEDWLGLNHMYGSEYTWTGGQTFGYLNALNRSAIKDNEITMRAFITPSDDKFLRLKA